MLYSAPEGIVILLYADGRYGYVMRVEASK